LGTYSARPKLEKVLPVSPQKSVDAIRDVVLAKEVWERTQKTNHFKQRQTHFKAVFNEIMKKVWERRSHALPPHYTPGCNKPNAVC